jgi:hypothetical protein
MRMGYKGARLRHLLLVCSQSVNVGHKYSRRWDWPIEEEEVSRRVI